MPIYGSAAGANVIFHKNNIGVAFGGGGAPEPAYTSGLGSAGNWTTVTSMVMNNNDASPSGLGTNSWVFNGSTSTIRLTVGQIVPTNSDFTISFWLRPDTLSGTQIQLSTTGGGSAGLEIGMHGGGSEMGVSLADGTGNNVSFEDPHGMSVNTWNNWIVTFNASTGKLTGYVNTVEKGTGTDTDVDTIATITDWFFCSPSAEKYDGRVLDMAIWNIVLSSDNITSLWSSGNGALANTVQKDKIVCYWDSQTVSAPIENLAIP